MSRAIAIDLCGLPKIDVITLRLQPASAYFIRYKVRALLI